MNRLLIPLCLALTVAACASTPATSPPLAATTTAGALRNCQPINPSAPQTNCANVNGSVYKAQQWETKGATTTAEALQQVSPSVSVH